jgi:hypothetical protein
MDILLFDGGQWRFLHEIGGWARNKNIHCSLSIHNLICTKKPQLFFRLKVSELPPKTYYSRFQLVTEKEPVKLKNRRLETMAAPLLIFLIVRQSSVSFRCDCCGHAVQVKSLVPSRILEHFFTATIGPLVTHHKTQAGKPRFSLLLFLLDKRMKKRSSDPWLNICTAYTSHVFAKLEGRLEPYGAYLVKSPLMEVLVSAMPCFVLQSLFYITAGLRPALFWHCLCQSHIGVVPLICLLFSCM